MRSFSSPISSRLSWTGISSAVVTTTTPNRWGSAMNEAISVAMWPIGTASDDLGDQPRRRQPRRAVAGRRGVEHHHVGARHAARYVALDQPVGMAEHRGLLEPGGPLGEVLVDRAGKHSADQRAHLELVADQVVEQHPRVEVVKLDARCDVDQVAAGRGHVEQLVQALAGVDLEQQDPSAACRELASEDRRDGGLADATLAGDDEHLALLEPLENAQWVHRSDLTRDQPSMLS